MIVIYSYNWVVLIYRSVSKVVKEIREDSMRRDKEVSDSFIWNRYFVFRRSRATEFSDIRDERRPCTREKDKESVDNLKERYVRKWDTERSQTADRTIEKYFDHQVRVSITNQREDSDDEDISRGVYEYDSIIYQKVILKYRAKKRRVVILADKILNNINLRLFKSSANRR